MMVSFLMGMIVMLGFLVSIPISIPFVANILGIVLSILIGMSEFFSKLPLSQVLVCSPPILVVVLYYCSLLTWVSIQNIRQKTDKRRIHKQFLKGIEHRKKWLWRNKKRVVAVLTIVMISCFVFKTLLQAR